MKLIRKWLKSIGSLLWPILKESEKNGTFIQTKTIDINIPEDLLSEYLNMLHSLFKEEQARLKAIENKASIFIGIISVVTSIFIAFQSSLSESKEGLDILFSLLLIIQIVYLLKTLQFSLKALGKSIYMYSSISNVERFESRTSKDFYHLAIKDMIKCIEFNFPVINKKVDQMVMAQKYFRRVLYIFWVVAFISLVRLIQDSFFENILL